MSDRHAQFRLAIEFLEWNHARPVELPGDEWQCFGHCELRACSAAVRADDAMPGGGHAQRRGHFRRPDDRRQRHQKLPAADQHRLYHSFERGGLFAERGHRAAGFPGYVTVWPTGQALPGVSTLNRPDGSVRSTAAIIPAGTGGAISVFADNAPTDVVVDINGYFVPAGTSGALAFYPVTPCRMVDTRTANGDLGGPYLAAGVTRIFPLLEASSCGVSAQVQAYSLNLTAVPRGSVMHWLTAWASGQAQPGVATLNDPTATVLANAAIVPAGAGGDIAVYSLQDTDLVIDVNGYFAPPGAGGLSLYNLTPCRVLDTRQPTGSQPFNGTLNVDVAGSGCGVPASAQAYVFNATVVPPGLMHYLTLWPQGIAQPGVSSLNDPAGIVRANMAIVPTSNGSISAFVTNPTYLILDVFGYFAP